MRWTLALGLLLVAPLLAGCMVQQEPDDPSDATGESASSTSTVTRVPSRSTTTATSRPSGSGAGGQGGGGADASSGGSSGNGSLNATGPARWADLGAAAIRPGVQVFADGSQCTSNFLFTSPDNSTAYLGFAAHCVTKNDPNDADDGCDPSSEPLAIGTPIEVEGADHPATLAYTSWGSMQSRGGASGEECLYNDFAFAALDPRDAAKA
ncbi:MAG TPA: hypothetical protein VM327_10550, partial [Candidatus Thermoplasmatota archaeon]|nr:hypothetical protein [Candidatus Thermoplasmatota archaeon]